MNDNVSLKGARWWKEVGWKHILAVILMIYCIFPLLYVLSASLNPGGTISGSSELFRNVSLENYATLFGTNFPRWMLQSFVVSTGALQAIPAELTEAAIMDGAGAWRRFRSVTLPMLMVSLAPLLIASFAFNFNNFSLIYMLTGGGPNYSGTPLLIGETDILLSMVYSIAFESGGKQYGLASALSLLIFVVVGIISWLGFRQTRKLEEIM